jgi:glycosyltransferase involved in cell wall biosynthesis
LRSWVAVSAEHPEALLLVAGGQLTDENTTLVEMIAELDLPSDPRLVGPVDDPKGYLASLHCLVSPSRTEGFPNVIAEAMSLGVPVIATNVGGTPEVLGECGMLIEAERPDLLAIAVSSFLDDPSELRRRAAAGPDRVANEFSRARSLDETNAFYARLRAVV